MKFSKYLKNNYLIILLFIVIIAIIDLMLVSFKTNNQAIVGVTFTGVLGFILYLIYDFYRRKKFYDKFINDLDLLDKKYLITEMIEKPNFYEGEILYDALYEIDKSMLDNIKEYSLNIQDFKEYIEMWIHEAKLPLASLNLIVHNHKELSDKKITEQLKRLDDDIEQVLYYVRSENAEQDYLITDCSLNKIISNVALRNKDIIFREKINLFVENVDYTVLTDSKWLEFILNQIINNSIKYKKEQSSYIKISAQADNDKTILIIEDNGIGISASDLPKVFNKSFTGKNGRIRKKATGMGLFIVKNLCDKLGHKIEVKSKENKYTKIYIIFPKNRFYEEIR